MVGEITYNYTPNDWDQKRFLELGGFTVVFLNYNKAKFIKKSVASALKQDYPLLEMFFMDDASTDGSGDTMERLVREYSGRHKVTVVRNSENQYITGQWNIVAKLATGNWLGMFCGDDIAHTNRISLVAGRLRTYPTALGICTSGNKIDETTGETMGRLGRPFDFGRLHLMTGCSDLVHIADEYYSVMGATAFWHKSLFQDGIPGVRLDDVALRWLIMYKTFGNDAINFIWDGTIATIDYQMGSGITSGYKTNQDGDCAMRQWQRAILQARYYARNEFCTWNKIEWFFRTHNAPRSLIDVAERTSILNGIVCGSLLYRMRILPRILCIACRCKHRSPYGKELLLRWLKVTMQEFFGLKFASFISIYVLKRASCGNE